MEIKKLKTATLLEALTAMSVGETVTAPEGYSDATVKRACSDLNRRGCVFRTTNITGVRTITRLK